MADSRLSSRHSLPTETDPTKQRTQKSKKQAGDLFVCYHHSTSYLFHRPMVGVMIKSCMLQVITGPCYDAEVIAACLSANSVRRSFQSKELRTSIGLGKNSPMEVWISMHIHNVSRCRVLRRKGRSLLCRQHFNHAHPMIYSHQTSYIRTPANCIR